MTPKSAHHFAIVTRNFAAMEEFYTKTLGLKAARRWDDLPILFIDIGSSLIELIGKDDAPAAGAPAGGFDHLAIEVDDVDATFAQVKAAGARVKMEPTNFKDVRIAFFFDPDGNAVEIIYDPLRAGK